MSQKNNNMKTRKFKQLTFRDRIKIEALLKENFKASEIAISLGFSKRTINREIKQGMVIGLLNHDYSTRNEYSADKAQRASRLKASYKGRNLKISNCIDLSKHFEKEIIENKKSPYAVLKDIEKNNTKFEVSICVKTLYSYIHAKLFIKLNTDHLPYKKRRKKAYSAPHIADNNRKGTSIEERDPSIELREEYGHWEIDCVVGKRKGKGCVLLTLIERKTRKFIVRKIKSKTQESVIRELDKIEKEYGKAKFKKAFKTITADNGVEFLDQKGMEKSSFNSGKRTQMYYCHAYCSWERGSNENANKLIRRWIPKGSDINNYTKKEIKRIETWINNYPRKIFDGLTSIEVENKCFTA